MSCNLRRMIGDYTKTLNSTAGGYAGLRKLDANVREPHPIGTLLMQKLGRREGLVTLGHA